MSKKNILRIVVVVVLIVVLLFAARESTISHDSETIKISGMYGTTMEIQEVTSVEIRDSLPEIHRRKNGIGILGLRKGHFTMDEFDKARLLLHSGSGPFIIIQTTDEVVIVNFRDSERTQTEYNKIADLVN